MMGIDKKSNTAFFFLHLSVAQLVERGIVVGLSWSLIQYSYGHWFESDRRDFLGSMAQLVSAFDC